MIPEGFATLYAFLGLVAPGLLFQFLRERARPALEETAFREASRVAITSLVFTTASIWILALVSRALPGALIDLSEWIRLQSVYVGNHLWLVAWSVLAEVGLACLIAWLVAAALAKWFDDSGGRYSKTSVWHLAFSASKPDGKAAWVEVRLADDSKAWGYIHYFTTDLSLEKRELSLKGPGLAVQPKGGDLKELDRTYLVIPGPEIRRIGVSFKDTPC
ncbi:DUF6338 family protein [Promicromonospora sp. MS192]|uniref:DUF6338 family protein n=1 Tax=Promicromonospora sp. MS192 TaxID=3412684 RepID=UPI003C30E551